MLCLWLERKTEITKFGIVETDRVGAHELGLTLLEFAVNDECSQYAPILEEWARRKSRLFGKEENGEVIFAKGKVVKLPPKPNVEVPEWMKR